MCDRLVVGVTTDALMWAYKKRRPVIPYEERAEIVRHIQFVDKVVAQTSMNKFAAWEQLQFDIMFVGDDWRATEKWEQIESEFNDVGVRIVYFPYTKGTSSTLINEILVQQRDAMANEARGESES